MTVTVVEESADSPVRGMAVVVALVVAALAVAGVLLFYARDGHGLARVSMPTSHRASVQPTVAPQPADPGDRDGQLMFQLTSQGFQPSGGRRATINDAHRVCSRVQGGESERQVVQDIVEASPSLTPDNAAAFAHIAIDTFCPLR